MELEIWQAGEATKLELADGEVSVGGAAADGVQLEGLPPSLLRLSIEGARLTVRTRETVSIGEVLFPPGVPRLLMPGESLNLSDEVRLLRPAGAREVEARENAVTAQVLKQLLWDVAEPGESKAATLVCLTGLDVGRVYPLAGSSVEIGRGDRAGVRVRDRAVSRRHARVVHRAPAGYLIEDLGGPNATFVDGQQVKGRRTLTDGAVIELGHSMLRFSGPAAPPPPPPPEPEAVAPVEGEPTPPDTGAALAAGPDDAQAPVAAAAPAPRSLKLRRAEWVLIGIGATLAITGLMVSCAL
ncbi:MAG: FHA domain-containing protein [Myxococcaceae bacterium]